MKKVKYYISHFFMNLGMLSEKIWDETKKFIWWIFAPDAYADLYHDYKALQKGYDDLYAQWVRECGDLFDEVTQLTKENDKLRAELEKLKQA